MPRKVLSCTFPGRYSSLSHFVPPRSSTYRIDPRLCRLHLSATVVFQPHLGAVLGWYWSNTSKRGVIVPKLERDVTKFQSARSTDHSIAGSRRQQGGEWGRSTRNLSVVELRILGRQWTAPLSGGIPVQHVDPSQSELLAKAAR